MTAEEMRAAAVNAGWLDNSSSETFVSLRRTFPRKGSMPDYARVLYGTMDGQLRVGFCPAWRSGRWEHIEPIDATPDQVLAVLGKIEQSVDAIVWRGLNAVIKEA